MKIVKILHYSYKNQLLIELHFHLSQEDGLKHLQSISNYKLNYHKILFVVFDYHYRL